jgi:hypothetical protein
MIRVNANYFGRKRGPYNYKEGAISEAFYRWWMEYATVTGLDYRLLWHTPNEGKRSLQAGARMKRLGRVAGVPDYFLAMPRGNFHGLFIEMKAEGGAPTPAQMDMMEILIGQGYKALVALSAVEASDAVENYLKLGTVTYRLPMTA